MSAKRTYLTIRINAREKQKLMDAANAEGVYFSRWARDILEQEADKVLRTSCDSLE